MQIGDIVSSLSSWKVQLQTHPPTIAECDATGISSNYIDVQTERLKWLQENLSPQLYSTYIDILEYKKSDFKTIIPTMNHTKKFQKRAYRLVRYLLKLNTLFSSRHDHTEDVYNSILYRPFLNK